MGGFVNARQVPEIQVRINLGGADVGVAEQFLDSAQIAARFEQMCCEGMAKHMRVHVHADALPARPVRNPQLHRSNREPAPSGTHEQRCRRRPELGALEHLRTFDEPVLERIACKAADRDDSSLAALAEHSHGAILQIELRDIKPHEFAEP